MMVDNVQHVAEGPVAQRSVACLPQVGQERDLATMSKGRRRRANVTTEHKVRMLRRHLREDVPISDLCDRYDIQPNQFQTWQKQLRGRRRSSRSGSGWSTIWSGRICHWDV